VCVCVCSRNLDSEGARVELSDDGKKIHFSYTQNSSKPIEWRIQYQQNDSKLMYRKCNEFGNDSHKSKLHSSGNGGRIKFGE
jgi:outer membrane biogenesis lipoprotein LolB